MDKRVVFLCGARDFHAMDWYKSAKELMPDVESYIVTDLIAGEGFKKIVNEKDKVYKLLILDFFLFKNQSALGDKWRNFLKLIVLPLQILLLKRFAKKYPGLIYHAHSMYYLVLARAANVNYIGTPQGSDILIKPKRSIFFKYFSIYGLMKAKHVTVDSKNMQQGVFNLTGRHASIIQNGIDLDAINFFAKNSEGCNDMISCLRTEILSIRGFTPLYRIKDILIARNRIDNEVPITFIYPFYEFNYKAQCSGLLYTNDIDLGKVHRSTMYGILYKSKLVISIPSSDSSPRSVYEAIFCGSAVAITYNSYYELLPYCMKSRIIIVDINNENWFADAIYKAELINKKPYIPSDLAKEMFNQKESFKKLQELLFG